MGRMQRQGNKPPKNKPGFTKTSFLMECRDLVQTGFG